MKTSDLSGNALCYAVTTLEMPHLEWGKTIGTHWASNQIVVPELPEPDCYSPFTDWRMCGPIIERECIATYASGACSVAPKNPDYWVAEILDTSEMLTQYGPTPLIAAMRAFVASRLGDEVEVPEELQP